MNVTYERIAPLVWIITCKEYNFKAVLKYRGWESIIVCGQEFSVLNDRRSGTTFYMMKPPEGFLH